MDVGDVIGLRGKLVSRVCQDMVFINGCAKEVRKEKLTEVVFGDGAAFAFLTACTVLSKDPANPLDIIEVAFNIREKIDRTIGEDVRWRGWSRSY